MKDNRGGQTVKGGFYWNRKDWEIVVLSGEGGELPGNADEVFVRLPILLFLVMAPILGGLYVVFLPVIGFALFFQHLGRNMARGMAHAVSDTAATIGMPWRPGEAWFAGRRGKKVAARKAIETRSADPGEKN